MKTVPVADLGARWAQVLREVQSGETFTVTSEGRLIATISPYVAPDGPRTWVPAHQVVGALAHLDLPTDFAQELRADLDDRFDPGFEDPFERRDRRRAGKAWSGRQIGPVTSS